MTKEKIESILAGYATNKKEGLLPILQDIQAQNGYLTEEILAEVGKYLNLPANKIYGVATFYDQFRFSPCGQFHIRICRGTSCHLFGSSTYLERLETGLKVKAGHVSRDKKVSIEITSCMGACESAPVIRVNDEYHTHVTEEGLRALIQSIKEKTK
jgi:NADH-quinone oxidoreductase subunit E